MRRKSSPRSSRCTSSARRCTGERGATRWSPPSAHEAKFANADAAEFYRARARREEGAFPSWRTKPSRTCGRRSATCSSSQADYEDAATRVSAGRAALHRRRVASRRCCSRRASPRARGRLRRRAALVRARLAPQRRRCRRARSRPGTSRGSASRLRGRAAAPGNADRVHPLVRARRPDGARDRGSREQLAHALLPPAPRVHVARLAGARATSAASRCRSTRSWATCSARQTSLNNLGIDAYYEGRWDDALELLRAKPARARADRRRRRRGDDREQHRRDPLRPGTNRRGAGALRGSRRGVPRRARTLPRARRHRKSRTAGRERRALRRRRAGAGSCARRVRPAEGSVLHAGGPGPARRARRAPRRSTGTGARTRGVSPCRGARERRIPTRGGLLRLVGYAHAQSGLTVEARAAFEESLAAAQSTEAEYEQALAHQALAAVGEDADHNAARAQSLLEQLGVVSLPPIPLP